MVAVKVLLPNLAVMGIGTFPGFKVPGWSLNLNWRLRVPGGILRKNPGCLSSTGVSNNSCAFGSGVSSTLAGIGRTSLKVTVPVAL